MSDLGGYGPDPTPPLGVRRVTGPQQEVHQPIGSKLFWVMLTAIVVAAVAGLAGAMTNPFKAATKEELAEVKAKNDTDHAAFSKAISDIASDARVARCYIQYPRPLKGIDANAEKRDRCLLEKRGGPPP